MNDAPSITVPGRAIKAATYFMSADETRYVLKGVHLCRAGGHNIVVAADGRQMLVLTLSGDTEPWPDGFKLTLVPKHVLTMMAEHGGSGDDLEIAQIDEKRVRVKGMIGDTKVVSWEIVTECTDWVGTYPSWWKVLPEPCAPEKRVTAHISLNPERLAQIKDAFGVWLKREPILTLHMPEVSADGTIGVIAITTSRQDALALLMPCRGDLTERIPDFVAEVVKAGNEQKGAKP